MVLRRLLTRRFGALPEWASERLVAATVEQVEQWADRILDAATGPAIVAKCGLQFS